MDHVYLGLGILILLVLMLTPLLILILKELKEINALQITSTKMRKAASGS